MTKLIEFKNLKDIDAALTNEAVCRDYYESVRWEAGIFCPHCGSTKQPYKLKRSKNQNEYKCSEKECRKKFNCLTGTIFENTKISLITWFKAIHLVTSLSKGISSVNIAKLLGTTQKTGWFLIHRIREMLKEDAPVMLEGVTETDEVWIGGSDKNRPVHKRSGIQGNTKDKTPVLGLVQRPSYDIVIREHKVIKGRMVKEKVLRVDSKLYCLPVQTNKGEHILPIMRAVVKPLSTIYTDQHLPYRSLKNNYTHDHVNHSADEYVRGEVHTGFIDGAWGLFKKKVNGIHHHVSDKHLHRYCNEFAFSYNNKKVSQFDKFNAALNNCGNNRLLYKVLIADMKER